MAATEHEDGSITDEAGKVLKKAPAKPEAEKPAPGAAAETDSATEGE